MTAGFSNQGCPLRIFARRRPNSLMRSVMPSNPKRAGQGALDEAAPPWYTGRPDERLPTPTQRKMSPPGGIESSQRAVNRAVREFPSKRRLPEVGQVIAGLHLEEAVAMFEPCSPDDLPVPPLLGTVPGRAEGGKDCPVKE